MVSFCAQADVFRHEKQDAQKFVHHADGQADGISDELSCIEASTVTSPESGL